MTLSPAPLPARFPHPASPALGGGLAHLDDFGHLPMRSPDLIGDGQDAGPELLRILDPHPLPVAQHDVSARRPDAGHLLDRDEIDTELAR